MIKFKLFWYKNKYDIVSVIVYIILWYSINTVYDIRFFHWQFWAILTCMIIFRLMGYRQGKQDISRALTTNLNDITLDAPNDNVTEAIIDLQYLQDGMTFSLFYKILSHKFIKCETNDNEIKCWDINDCKFVVFQKTTPVILYRTKTIYFPVVKIKKRDK